MSIARSLASVLPSFDKATNITDEHSVKNNSEEVRTLMFNDLSLLKINENEQKGYIAEAKHVEKVEFGGIKKQKKLFGAKKQIYSDIVSKNSPDDESDLSFVKIKISKKNRIEFGMDSLFLTSERDCFSLSLTGSVVKGLKRDDAAEFFSLINVDADHLTSFLKEKNERNELKKNYKHDDQDILGLINNKSDLKEKNEPVKSKRKNQNKIR